MMGCTFSSSSTSSDANDEGSPNFRAPERTEQNSLDPVVRVPGEYPMAGVLSVKQITRSLVKPQPYRHCTTMTMGALTERRNHFWRSRTGGSAEIWLAIRASAEALLADDVTLAAAILKANKIGTSNGSLELCFDDLCRPYRTPMFCIIDPLNILRPNNPKALVKAISRTSSQSTFCIHQINLKIRINPGEFELTVSASTADTILDLKHSILELSSQQRKSFATIPTCEEQRQRIVFMGQELENAQVLGDIGADEFLILQVFLRPTSILEVVNE